MNAREVLSGAGLKSAIPEELAERTVDGIAYDSRKVGPDYLFFAFPGARADGRRFAGDAVSRGALAVISEMDPPVGYAGVWLQVHHGRRALAIAAGRFHGHPDRTLKLTGITGTNGKTTTSHLIDSILHGAGFTTGLVGTIEYRLAGQALPAVNTTPESLDLFELLATLARQGGTHATMEVSSHALSLGRVYSMQFHTAVWTNLTRDHLDFHGDMEDYFRSKAMLFQGEDTHEPKHAVINSDDEWGRALKTKSETAVLTYGLESDAAVRATHISSGFEGLRFDIVQEGRTHPVRSPLVGRVNVYNILAAWCTAWTHGIAPEIITHGIAKLAAVPGRFQRVQAGQPFLVVVDYAHTDDALRNTIASARALTNRRVITVFGCGGDRDRAKRPLMGMAAAQASDYVVITSDNPRSEDPLIIINDALVGVRRFDTPHIVEPDRQAAIGKAIEQAQAGDVVIIAGKGHENYQILGDCTIHFDDREIALEVLEGLGYGREGVAR